MQPYYTTSSSRCLAFEHHTLHSSSSSALQLFASFGLLNYILPLFPLIMSIFSGIGFFSGTRLLALRPTPNLKEKGVSLRLASTL